MFGQYLMRMSRFSRNVRYFRSNVALRDVKEVSTPGANTAAQTAVPNQTKVANTEQVLGPRMHKCGNFNKRVLVWMKKYPSIEAVPEKVSFEVLQKAQTQARIRVANLMMVFTLIGCIWAIVTGKRDAKAGKTLYKDNQDWHNQINQEYKANLAAATKTT